MRQRENHTTDMLFTLGLFCVFAASAFILVMIGIRVYQSEAEQMQDTFSARTAISYVTEKLRQHDAAGAAQLVMLEGEPALCLKDRVGDSVYDTYIYSDSEYLYELTAKEGAGVSRSLGEQVIAVRNFEIRDAGDGFLEFGASDSEGRTVRFLMHLRSRQP